MLQKTCLNLKNYMLYVILIQPEGLLQKNSFFIQKFYS